MSKVWQNMHPGTEMCLQNSTVMKQLWQSATVIIIRLQLIAPTTINTIRIFFLSVL